MSNWNLNNSGINHHVSSSLIPVCGLGRHTLKNGALFCKKLYLNLIACIWSSIVLKSEGYCAKSQSCVVFLPSAIATKLLQRLLYVAKSVGLNSRLMSSYVISFIGLISCLHYVNKIISILSIIKDGSGSVGIFCL